MGDAGGASASAAPETSSASSNAGWRGAAAAVAAVATRTTIPRSEARTIDATRSGTARLYSAYTRRQVASNRRTWLSCCAAASPASDDGRRDQAVRGAPDRGARLRRGPLAFADPWRVGQRRGARAVERGSLRIRAGAVVPHDGAHRLRAHAVAHHRGLLRARARDRLFRLCLAPRAQPHVAVAAAIPATRAMAVAFGNSVQLGIPMATALFGEEGLAIHIPLVSLHALILLSVLTALVELDLARAAHGRGTDLSRCGARSRRPCATPCCIPCCCPCSRASRGTFSGCRFPHAWTRCWCCSASAVVPLCLVLIGVSLAQYGIKGHCTARRSRRSASCSCCRRPCCSRAVRLRAHGPPARRARHDGGAARRHECAACSRSATACSKPRRRRRSSRRRSRSSRRPGFGSPCSR